MGDTKFRSTGRRTARGPYRAEERDRRRAEGEARNQAWRLLSSEEQLTSLQGRRGLSYRQTTMIAERAMGRLQS